MDRTNQIIETRESDALDGECPPISFIALLLTKEEIQKEDPAKTRRRVKKGKTIQVVIPITTFTMEHTIDEHSGY